MEDAPVKLEIITRSAEKGLGTVVMSKDYYLVRVLNQLDNIQHYELFSENPMERFLEETTAILTEMMEKGV